MVVAETIVIVDTSAYAPLTPLFGEVLRDNVSVSLVDEAEHVRPLTARLVFRSGRVPDRIVRERRLNSELLDRCRRLRPNLVIVVKGTFITKETVQRIRAAGAVVVNYLTDDPFNARASPSSLQRAIGSYDVVFSPRTSIIPDLTAAGCRRIEFLPFAYNPAVHFPERLSAADFQEFWCDMSFIGGADEGRARFIESLLRQCPDLRLLLYGGSWSRYPRLRKHARGTVMGRNFRLAVAASSVSLNLVRRSNRDGHVMRSYELPACGAAVVAERTEEHQMLFAEHEELLLFNSVEECAALTNRLLHDDDARSRLRTQAHRSVVSSRNTYADRFASIVEACERER